MKTVYQLETYDELAVACSDVRQEGDNLPRLTGKLKICGEPGDHPHVLLLEDPRFTFSMPLNEFLNAAIRHLPIPPLCGTDNLTLLNRE